MSAEGERRLCSRRERRRVRFMEVMSGVEGGVWGIERAIVVCPLCSGGKFGAHS